MQLDQLKRKEKEVIERGDSTGSCSALHELQLDFEIQMDAAMRTEAAPDILRVRDKVTLLHMLRRPTWLFGRPDLADHTLEVCSQDFLNHRPRLTALLQFSSDYFHVIWTGEVRH